MTVSAGITHEITEWVQALSYKQMPEDVVAAAKKGIVDTIAVMLVGGYEPSTRIVADMLRAEGAEPISRQVGSTFRTSPRGAALVNGTSGHALDYDDVHSNAQGHPSTVVLPAALAIGEMIHASGQQLIEAYIAGIEVMGKVGTLLGESAYARGWHATAILGPLASAMAAGKLLGLNSKALSMALGVAVSQAGGSRQNFGTMVKPLHAGWAAASGVVAAQLASTGMTADRNILEAPLGMLALYNGETSRWKPDSLGNPFEIVSPGLGVKIYPCCAGTHRALDATLHLRQAAVADASDIAEVHIRVHKNGLAPLIYERPSTGLEGKFCMGYVVAVALLDGRISIETFTDEMIRRRDVNALMDVIHVVEGEEAGGHFAEVAITLKNGESVSKRVDHPRGTSEVPLNFKEVRDKFYTCAGTVLPEQQSHTALTQIEELEKVSDIESILEVLVP